MNHTEKRDIKRELNKLKTSFTKINKLYDTFNEEQQNKFAKKYPFKRSFDELALEVEDWVEDLIETL